MVDQEPDATESEDEVRAQQFSRRLAAVCDPRVIERERRLSCVHSSLRFLVLLLNCRSRRFPVW